MKKNRKQIAASLLLALSLTACGSQNTAVSGTEEPAKSESEEKESTSPTTGSASSETTAAGLFIPGTYEAGAQGFGGEVTVTITVTEDEITEVVIKGDGETPSLGGVAVERLGKAMVEAQAPEVDSISGATVTSNAIIAAATEALTKAGADVAALNANKKDSAVSGERKEETLETDIVIIGAGGAGMTAAISAKQAKIFFCWKKWHMPAAIPRKLPAA